MESLRKYEGVFIFPPDASPDSFKEEEKRLEDLMSRLGGRVVDRNDWGRRLLGYRLRKFSEGRILLWHFEMEPARIVELRKALQLDEKILKAAIAKTEIPKPPKESQKKPKVRPVRRPLEAPSEANRGRQS